MSEQDKKELNESVSGIQNDIGDIKNTLEKDANFLKKHLPLIIFLCTAAGIIFGLGVSWVKWDQAIVRKPDLNAVASKKHVDSLNAETNDKLDQIIAENKKDKASKDSIDKKIIAEVDSDHAYIVKLKAAHKPAIVNMGEKYNYDAHGHRVVTAVQDK